MRGGPVLAALRAWPPVLGFVFGAFGEASAAVEELVQAVAALQAASAWRTMGARDEDEARAFLLAHLRRRWGRCAVRERARMLIARIPHVGRRAQTASPCATQNSSLASACQEAVLEAVVKHLPN